MAHCGQAASHYLSQYWSRSMSPEGLTNPHIKAKTKSSPGSWQHLKWISFFMKMFPWNICVSWPQCSDNQKDQSSGTPLNSLSKMMISLSILQYDIFVMIWSICQCIHLFPSYATDNRTFHVFIDWSEDVNGCQLQIMDIDNWGPGTALCQWAGWTIDWEMCQ